MVVSVKNNTRRISVMIVTGAVRKTAAFFAPEMGKILPIRRSLRLIARTSSIMPRTIAAIIIP